MDAVIYTEGSQTTVDTEVDYTRHTSSSTNPSSNSENSVDIVEAREYFKGTFRVVNEIVDSLDDYGNVSLQILSKEYGIIDGREPLQDSQIEYPFEEVLKTASQKLVDDVSNADVVVLLLTRNSFNTVVDGNWDELCAAAKEGSYWCISASQSCFDTIDLSLLYEKDCTVLKNVRLGVERISTGSREELTSIIDSEFGTPIDNP